ncbi:2-dehydropantoate 2-reductase, partial [Candidatus Bathyarchaeota archaeon]|nr:2-dehydropantoate 2-reductase [Candidatus Bathyarchaeota archaeon]
IKEMIDAGVSNFFNYSSMCQDMIKRKKTEIDFLNGKVVELGRKHDIPTPFNELIVAFIKFLEEKSENRS